ncbi:MAG: cysteine desulfurase family protein [Candidatus Paracaedibacteraceae bacterium]|nr:cysteine desulfurase family protein [Candidatus Paracaedibacteraceae bacterium]
MHATSILNFDYNATAPLLDSVRDNALMMLNQLNGNPSSIHLLGRNARAVMESARERMAAVLLVKEKQIIFTSGATEANATVLKGFKGPILVSAIEHTSILAMRDDITLAPVDENGVVILDFIDKWLAKHPGHALVSIMAANNETGVIQPTKDIYNLCKKSGAFFHSDIVQAIGRIPLDLNNFDCVSISAHKLGGLQGVGCIIMREEFPFNALLKGGGQERSYRAGTENILGIQSFAVALEHSFESSQFNNWFKIEQLRLIMENELSTYCPNLHIMGKNTIRLPNTTCITMPGLKAETQVIRFDLESIAVSSGSACSSGKVKKSHVLEAMGTSKDVMDTAIRVSLSQNTTDQDIKTFINTWKKIYNSVNHATETINAA